MTRTHLFLKSDTDVRGMVWKTGPVILTDDAWIRMLREAGAEVITEEQYNELVAVGREDEETAPASRNGEADSGAHDAGDGGRDQISAADSLRQSRSRRGNRRVS